MKYMKYVIGAVALILAISSVTLAPQSHTETAFLLDTYISVTAYGKGAKTATKQAMARVAELDKKLCAYKQNSEVYKINHAGAKRATKVSSDCFYVMKQALILCEKTGGAFDITIKPVADLWGFGSENPHVPTQAELDKALSCVSYKDVLLDEQAQTVTLQKDGMAIDLGGIAKGYCADEAAKVLAQAGIQNGYLDFGGNVITMGEKPLGLWDRIKSFSATRPFLVGIQDPGEARGQMIGVYTTDGGVCSVVTSGGYERFFEEKGQAYHHILDPKTGKQPQNDIISVTVIGDSSLTCDALSTALFVLGQDGYERVCDLGCRVQFVTTSKEVQKYNP